MSECQTCGETLKGEEKFCGSCGKPAQQAAAAPIEQTQAEVLDNLDSAREPKPQPNGTAQNSRKNQTNILAGFVIAILVIGGGFYFFSTSGDGPTPLTAQQPEVAQPAQTAVVSATPAQQSPSRTTSATSPILPVSGGQPETISDAVRDYLAQATQANIDGGIADIAPYRMSVPSCTNCAPILIYCVEPIQNVSDLKGRAVRAHSTAAKELVTQVGGNLQLMVFGEVSKAMQMGLIDCSMSGGIVPQ